MRRRKTYGKNGEKRSSGSVDKGTTKDERESDFIKNGSKPSSEEGEDEGEELTDSAEAESNKAKRDTSNRSSHYNNVRRNMKAYSPSSIRH